MDNPQNEKFLCSECNKEFTTPEARDMHKKAKHAEDNEEPLLTTERKKQIRNWSIGIAVLVLLGWGIYFVMTRVPAESDTLQINISQADMQNIPYGPVHWHPHLTIKIDNTTMPIPAGIGITIGRISDTEIGMDAGMAPTHTHNADSIIHIENTNPRAKPETLFLGYFFYVWKKEFSKDCLFDYCTNNGTLKMYVNGEESTVFENYFMQDGDEIVIEYATNTENASNAEKNETSE